MSVLFSKLITNEARVVSPGIESGWVLDCDATMFVDEHYNNTNDEFNGYLLEGVRLAFLANECESVEMIAESLSEVIGNIVEWFKKWLRKFKEFAMKILRKIYDFFVKGEESIKTFEKEYRNFEEFSVKGYEYTIISKDNNMKILGEFMNTINGAVLELAHSTPSTIDAKLATLKLNLCSARAMDVVRGAILNIPPVEHSDFKKELKASFRNKANDKTDIIVNPSTAVAMCKKFHMFKEAIEHCKAMKIEMEKMCELTIAWIEGEPDFMYSSLPKEGNYDFRRKQLNAIHQLYQTANLTAKQIQYTYDIYYAAKLDALHEAIQFYLKTIKTAFIKSKAGGK